MILVVFALTCGPARSQIVEIVTIYYKRLISDRSCRCTEFNIIVVRFNKFTITASRLAGAWSRQIGESILCYNHALISSGMQQDSRFIVSLIDALFSQYYKIKINIVYMTRPINVVTTTFAAVKYYVTRRQKNNGS